MEHDQALAKEEEEMKLIIWFIVILMSIPVCAHTEDSSFFTQISSQPVKLKNEIILSEDKSEPLISDEGTASQKLMAAVHDDLTCGYRVVDMDISPRRIVLLLDTTVASMIRIAQWDNENQTYSITDWPEMPDVFLDTYHDGNAVFFEWFDEAFADSEPVVMVSLEEQEGLWHVTRFTDAMTYSAEMTESGYLFCDYWEYEAEEYQHHVFSSTQMGDVTWEHIVEMIEEYNVLFPQRPSLIDNSWDETEIAYSEPPVAIPSENTVIDCVLTDNTAMLLVEYPDASRSFWGCLLTENGWQITKSSRLPSSAVFDTIPAGYGQIAIYLKETDGVGICYNISLHESGEWYVDQILNEDEGVISFEKTGLLYDTLGMIYGTCSLERNIANIDWKTYPRHLNDVLKTLEDDWGVIGEPVLPLYADWGCTQMLGTYLYGTPVHVLELTYEIPENIEGLALAQVSIAGSDIVGWMPAYGLFTGAEQLWTAEDENGEYEYTASWDAPNVAIVAGTPIYATPNGSVESKSDWDTHLQVLSRQEGWVFVLLDEYDLLTGYVRSVDCEFDQ